MGSIAGDDEDAGFRAGLNSVKHCQCRLSVQAIRRIERYWLAGWIPSFYAWAVRVTDVLSLLSTAARLPTRHETCESWITRLGPRRAAAAIILFCFLCMLVLEGCAGLALGESKSSVDGPPRAELPITFRTLDS